MSAEIGLTSVLCAHTTASLTRLWWYMSYPFFSPFFRRLGRFNLVNFRISGISWLSSSSLLVLAPEALAHENFILLTSMVSHPSRSLPTLSTDDRHLILDLDLEVKNLDRSRLEFLRVAKTSIDTTQKTVFIQGLLRAEVRPPSLVDGEHWQVLIQRKERSGWQNLQKYTSRLPLRETTHVMEGNRENGALINLKLFLHPTN